MSAELERLLEEADRTQTPVVVDVAELVRTLVGSCDVDDVEDWLGAVMLYKLRDGQMGALIESVLEHGMTVPLEVCSWGERPEWRMGNGHHRLIAALLCGLHEIPVLPNNTSRSVDSSGRIKAFPHGCYDPYLDDSTLGYVLLTIADQLESDLEKGN